MDLDGAVALVTGAGHRVGRALALALAGAGCSVFVHYHRSGDDAEKTAAEVGALGPAAATGSADLGDPDGARSLIERAAAALGPVTVLVNSASGFPEDTILDVDLAAWNHTMAVTITAPMLLTQAFARALPAGAAGAVVNVTDWRTARPYPDHFSYIVAKSALDGLTRAAAVALAPDIRVNAVALGAILPPPGEGSGYLKELAGTLPLQRVGGVEVVAEAVLHLLRNDFVTGEIVRLDGGAHLA